MHCPPDPPRRGLLLPAVPHDGPYRKPSRHAQGPVTKAEPQPAQAERGEARLSREHDRIQNIVRVRVAGEGRMTEENSGYDRDRYGRHTQSAWFSLPIRV